jgi:hypothetical protein
MTAFIPKARSLQNKILPKELAKLSAGHQASDSYAKSLKPPPVPQTPTIDEAASRLAQDDRLKRRRGALANIFAGNAAAPTVGKPTLGG